MPHAKMQNRVNLRADLIDWQVTYLATSDIVAKLLSEDWARAMVDLAYLDRSINDRERDILRNLIRRPDVKTFADSVSEATDNFREVMA